MNIPDHMYKPLQVGPHIYDTNGVSTIVFLSQLHTKDDSRNSSGVALRCFKIARHSTSGSR